VATAYLNRIATVVPALDVHHLFLDLAHSMLDDPRLRALFKRMGQKSQIDHRYSCLELGPDPTEALDTSGLYRHGAYGSTAERMAVYEREAPILAERAVTALELGTDAKHITHVLITTCTGLSAPGLDLELQQRCGLDPSVERTVIGFMGCYAGINALKMARHIVRSEPEARVLIANVELCTLHLKETKSLEQVLSFLVFADGAAASLVTAEPHGISLDRFKAVVFPEDADLITWKIRNDGFDMILSGGVPASLRGGLERTSDIVLAGMAPSDIGSWAVHPGGRSVLDAVEQALALEPTALEASRSVLRDFGNMSSATVMFVLQRLMQSQASGTRGCAMAFGPGLTAETMLYTHVG